MENLMRLMASGVLQKLLVKHLDLRIIVALTQWKTLILIIEGFRTQRLNIRKVTHRSRLDWLSTTIDTAARAAHNLDKLVICLALADLCQNFIGVLQSASNGNLDIHAAHMIDGLFDAFGSADLRILDGICLLYTSRCV